MSFNIGNPSGLTVQQFFDGQPEFTGSYIVFNLASLEAAAESVGASEIVLRENKSYLFTDLINIGTKKLVLNGAGVMAALPGAHGVQSSGFTCLESTDTSVYVGAGFVVAGQPEGVTRLLNLTNPINTRNSFTFQGVLTFNGNPSVVSGFQNILWSGRVEASTSGFVLTPTNAKTIRIQTLQSADDVTAGIMIDIPTEAPANCTIDILGCNVQIPSGKVAFNINNTTEQASSINISGNNSLASGGELITGLDVGSNNVLSQGNPEFTETRMTGETKFTDEAGVSVTATQNSWIPITEPYIFNTVSALGVDSPTEGVLRITRPSKDRRIRLRCQVSVDTVGGALQTAAMRIVKSTDNGLSWSPLDPLGVLFTSALSAESVSFETTDIANTGHRYRMEISNRTSNNNFKVYTSLMQVL